MCGAVEHGDRGEADPQQLGLHCAHGEGVRDDDHGAVRHLHRQVEALARQVVGVVVEALLRGEGRGGTRWRSV